MVLSAVPATANPPRRPCRALEPSHPLERAALVGVRWRRGNPCLRRDRIRVAQRLASGMTVPEVARAEGGDEAVIEDLLAHAPFRALVASQKALAERPAAEQTERLVKLARQAIENALNDWDMGAAFFVLREHAQGRDPALTVTRRVLAAARRAPAAPAAPPVPAPTLAAPETPPRAHDPLDALVHRQTAALRRAVLAEHAARAAAVGTAPAGDDPDPVAPPPPIGPAIGAAAVARQAPARERQGSGTRPCTPGRPAAGTQPSPASHGPTLAPAPAPAPAAPVPLAALPRRPRAP